MRANYLVHATPQFRVLSDDQIEEIYHAALDVLARVGTRVYGKEGLALLREAGCPIRDGPFCFSLLLKVGKICRSTLLYWCCCLFRDSYPYLLAVFNLLFSLSYLETGTI